MTIIIWILIATIVIVGLVGGYFQLMLFSNLKKKDIGNILFGAWVFDSDALNGKGKYYRRMIFACWGIIIALVIGIQLLR